MIAGYVIISCILSRWFNMLVCLFDNGMFITKTPPTPLFAKRERGDSGARPEPVLVLQG